MTGPQEDPTDRWALSAVQSVKVMRASNAWASA